MKLISSADGTAIATQSIGQGPPLVLVVGAFSNRHSGGELPELLAADYTLYSYDRRGRGESGDAEVYDTEREVEDLAAVMASIGAPCFLYGHSSGGILALETAARGVPVRKLAVYEPPYAGELAAGAEFAERLDQLCLDGRPDQAAEEFLTLTGAPPNVIADIKAAPSWPGMTALAHTLSRDLRLAGDGHVPTGRFANIAAPVLALAGAQSPDWAHFAVEAIAQAAPSGQARLLDGQGHNPSAQLLAPLLAEYFQ